MARPYAYWTEQRILRALRKDAERLGRTPTTREWERHDPRGRRPTFGTVKRTLGWRRALELAGLEPRPFGGRGFGAPRKTRCKRGHSLKDGDPNVALRKDGSRYCRACRPARNREARDREQAARGDVAASGAA
jgi:hypothetical protein